VNQHDAFALTRSPDSAPLKRIGAKPVIADGLDASAVKAVVGRIRPDAVINELTALPRHYTPAEMTAAAERDRKVRVEGNMNLLVALRDAGVRRYLLQSSGFWYALGAGLADESVPFNSSASPGVEAGARNLPGIGGARISDIGNRVRREARSLGSVRAHLSGFRLESGTPLRCMTAVGKTAAFRQRPLSCA
jgi:NAD dependent epimerase/dehydratase family